MFVVGLAFFALRTPDAPVPELRLAERPLTYGPNIEDHPTFSPDGTRVAYSDQDDIYITLTEPGAGAPTRVTNNSQPDYQPAWSPDGTKIVFARDTGRRTLTAADFQLVLASPVEASTVQVLGEFLGRGLQVRPAWTPDGAYVGFSCAEDKSDPIKRICIYEMETGESWALTDPSGDLGDEQVVFSPDRGRMAYQGSGSLYVMDLAEDMRSGSEPRHVANEFVFPSPIEWSPDGRELYFGGEHMSGESGLWSVGLDPGDEPRLIQAVQGRMRYPDLHWDESGSMRVVFRRDVRESRIMALDLTSPDAEPVVHSDAPGFADLSPRYSPDGRTAAFVSNRAGPDGVWLSEPDGSRPRLLANIPPLAVPAQPSWSPDGSRIAIDAVFRTQSRELYVIDIASRQPGMNLTSGRHPVFSRKGDRLYFGRGAGRGIHVFDLETKDSRPFLDERIFVWSIEESFDSNRLYVTGRGELWTAAISPDGHAAGKAVKLRDDVWATAVVERGVYLLTSGGEVVFLSPDGAEEPIAKVKAPRGPGFYNGITVSPDERRLLYTETDPMVSNLMLLEPPQ